MKASKRIVGLRGGCSIHPLSLKYQLLCSYNVLRDFFFINYYIQ